MGQQSGHPVAGFGGASVSSVIYLLIFIGVWFFLQAYLLPKLGVST
jgi:hypothetical protein